MVKFSAFYCQCLKISETDGVHRRTSNGLTRYKYAGEEGGEKRIGGGVRKEDEGQELFGPWSSQHCRVQQASRGYEWIPVQALRASWNQNQHAPPPALSTFSINVALCSFWQAPGSDLGRPELYGCLVQRIT